MAKKKQTSLLVKIILLVLACLMVVSVFTDLVTVKEKLTDDTKTITRVTGQDTFETLFEGHEIDAKDITKDEEAGKIELKEFASGSLKYDKDGNIFIVVMLELTYIVALISGIACLILSLLNLLGINLGILNKVFALVFMAASVIAFIFALIVANKMASTNIVSKLLNGMAGVGAWFMLVCGLGYGVTYLATCRK